MTTDDTPSNYFEIVAKLQLELFKPVRERRAAVTIFCGTISSNL
jgi:hypothetical protein